MFEPSELVQCHTPLKKLLPQYHDKFVLVSGVMGGIMNTVETIHSYGFKNVIHSEELAALIPELSPLTVRSLPDSLLHDRK